ncbi:MAG: FliG C-terminal domain-containing protein [Planctomycetota bacterium]
MKSQINGIRKAAILVACLDRSAADRVLDEMDPEQAQRVRRMTVELDDVNPEEERQIIDEFFRVRPMVPAKQPPGIELDGSLARVLSHRPGPFSSEEPRDSRASEGRSFRFLHEAEGEKLASLLANESPQTIALVISHLPREQAGNLLVRLGPSLQVDVLRRLVDLEETDPEILREVERALEMRFSKQVLTQRRRVAGLSAVAGILEASDRQVGTEILDNLALRDQHLAERLKPQRPAPEPLEFADVVEFDAVALAAVFQAAGTELVFLALVGAPPRLIDRVLQGLSERSESEAELVRGQLDDPGPTRLSDVEEAQRRIAEVAEQLAVEGRLRLPSERRSPYAMAEIP